MGRHILQDQVLAEVLHGGMVAAVGRHLHRLSLCCEFIFRGGLVRQWAPAGGGQEASGLRCKGWHLWRSMADSPAPPIQADNLCHRKRWRLAIRRHRFVWEGSSAPDPRQV